MTTTPPKPWYRSKTLWFNVALAAAGSWSYFESAVGNLRAAMSPEHFGILITVIGIVGGLLRLATTAAVTLKKTP